MLNAEILDFLAGRRPDIDKGAAKIERLIGIVPEPP
jgi:hypothetical protein